MIRFVFRALGFIMLAAAFAALVVDGTRSIAGGHLLQFSLAETAAWLGGARFAAVMGDLSRAPALAQALAAGLLAVPGWIVAGVLGLGLLHAGRPAAAGVGFARRRV